MAERLPLFHCCSQLWLQFGEGIIPSGSSGGAGSAPAVRCLSLPTIPLSFCVALLPFVPHFVELWLRPKQRNKRRQRNCTLFRVYAKAKKKKKDVSFIECDFPKPSCSHQRKNTFASVSISGWDVQLCFAFCLMPDLSLLQKGKKY